MKFTFCEVGTIIVVAWLQPHHDEQSHMETLLVMNVYGLCSIIIPNYNVITLFPYLLLSINLSCF